MERRPAADCGSNTGGGEIPTSMEPGAREGRWREGRREREREREREGARKTEAETNTETETEAERATETETGKDGQKRQRKRNTEIDRGDRWREGKGEGGERKRREAIMELRP